MPIISIEFAVFFLVFFPVYWLCRPSPNSQNGLLLVAGLSWLVYLHWGFALTVTIYSLVIAFVGVRIHSGKSQKTRQYWLWIGVLMALLGLCTFKYYDFFRPYLQVWLGDNIVDVFLPLGISYYTFQSIAYLVALYRQDDIALKGHQLLLHLSFFPTITAGPIFRAADSKSIVGKHQGAAAQIRQTTPRSVIFPALAVTLILLGIIKKWWLAGSLGDGWVDPVFDNPMQYDFWQVLLAIYGYTVQLFLDFSGYSDLVIGIAMLLGFQLPPNFFMPLKAFNIRDFWNRWHISLSTWIRDYIYIPLGGNRCSYVRIQINLLIAMVLSGIWHGYGWNFFLWGLLHGIALVMLNIGDKIVGHRNALTFHPLTKAIGIFVTLHFVCFTFVIFHTQTLAEASLMFSALIERAQSISVPELTTLLMLILFAVALIGYRIIAKMIAYFTQWLDRLPVFLWAIPLLIIFILVTVLAPSGIPGFIYANF
ncbi:MAG: alginate O-acetyltransferase [Gammaproteobacteria bacterium]|nr:MAG: alginate O-acetyltransferase [Gammaproteobacteria bacterium]